MNLLDYLEKHKGEETDACDGCEFEDNFPWEMPCEDCKYNHQSYYKRKGE